MSLKDFKDEFYINDRNLYAVICVSQRLEHEIQSPINRMLESIEAELRREVQNYRSIQTAYVYESPLLEVREFESIDKDTPFCYKEPCIGKDHNIAHILLMGLILLQELQNKEKRGEYRLYLLTDEKFNRLQVNQIVYEHGSEIRIHPMFENLVYKPILVKTEQAGGDILEEYFRSKKGLRPIFN